MVLIMSLFALLAEGGYDCAMKRAARLRLMLVCTLWAAYSENSLGAEPFNSVNTSPAVATHAHTNRLAGEKSPYLLQHQFNPVDWYAWNQDAFAKARQEKRPIFLSIGYSTCHWCHVMERESFENARTAEILNRYYVSVKVDRE